MKRLVKNIVARFGYRIQGTRYIPRQLLEPGHLRAIEFDDVICRHMFEHDREFTFIQVGAFDGVTRDPLRKYIEKCRWRGVLVEPQPRAASKLRELYSGNDRIIVVQAALDESNRNRTLFTVESEGGPDWAGGLASFDRETIVKHADLIPGLEGMIREVTVDCITFSDVLERLPSAQPDLMQIDTEGADAYILSLFPFDRVRPAIVHWEVKHLSKAVREECFDQLTGYGYRLATSGDEDAMAVLMPPAEA